MGIESELGMSTSPRLSDASLRLQNTNRESQASKFMRCGETSRPSTYDHCIRAGNEGAVNCSTSRSHSLRVVRLRFHYPRSDS